MMADGAAICAKLVDVEKQPWKVAHIHHF